MLTNALFLYISINMKLLNREWIDDKEFMAHIELTPQLIDFLADVTTTAW